MPMMVARLAGEVGAPFGIEWRLDGNQPGAQSAQHRLQRRIGPQADAVRNDLHRHVPVPQCPGEPREPRQIIRPRLDERLD